MSNSAEVLKNIPSEELASEVDLESGSLPSLKTLGVVWSASVDEFVFQTRCVDDDQFTKRSFLRILATVFDPLGLVSPFIVVGRIILQDIWIGGFDWDDPIADPIAGRIRNWLSQFSDLSQVHIPRCLHLPEEVVHSELHVFSDASEAAYGSVVYYRVIYANGSISCRLVGSRMHVAPLDSVSIPRLELQGAVLGCQLVESVAKSLSMPMSCITLWTDSKNVLWWVLNRSRHFKTFVANRVAEIQRIV